MFNRLENFLEQFPTNATSWSQATDEVYDLARTSREFLDEYDDVKVEAVDFATLELPLNGQRMPRGYLAQLRPDAPAHPTTVPRLLYGEIWRKKLANK